MVIGSSDLDGIVWYIDPVAATLLALLLLVVAVLISTDFLKVRVRQGKPQRRR